MSPEADAREKIDALLVAAGWAVQNYKAFNPGAARGIALREVPLASGRCDYLLLVDGVLVGVIEAKKEGTTLSTVSEQSGHYGKNLPDFLAPLLPGTEKSRPTRFDCELTSLARTRFTSQVHLCELARNHPPLAPTAGIRARRRPLAARAPAGRAVDGLRARARG
jgi:type I restriction enzyme R subunit